MRYHVGGRSLSAISQSWAKRVWWEQSCQGAGGGCCGTPGEVDAVYRGREVARQKGRGEDQDRAEGHRARGSRAARWRGEVAAVYLERADVEASLLAELGHAGAVVVREHSVGQNGIGHVGERHQVDLQDLSRSACTRAETQGEMRDKREGDSSAYWTRQQCLLDRTAVLTHLSLEHDRSRHCVLKTVLMTGQNSSAYTTRQKCLRDKTAVLTGQDSRVYTPWSGAWHARGGLA